MIKKQNSTNKKKKATPITQDEKIQKLTKKIKTVTGADGTERTKVSSKTSDKEECSLTVELIKKICSSLRLGNTQQCSVKLQGIKIATYYFWLRKANEEKPEPIYELLKECVMKAEAEAEARNVILIQEHAKTDWKASGWWLERKNKKDWGKDKEAEVETLENKKHEGLEAFKQALTRKVTKQEYKRRKPHSKQERA